MKPGQAIGAQPATLMKLILVHHIISKYIEEHKIPPSMMDLVKMKDDYGHIVSASSSVVKRYYVMMVERKMVQWTPKVSRGIFPLPVENWSEDMQVLYSEMQKRDKESQHG